MRQPNINKIEIVEPPIEELTKGHNSFKRTCLTGCGCIVFFIIGLFVALWLIIGPGPKTISTLPASFPTSVPVYAKDNIVKMTEIPAHYKSRGTKIASLFPQIILAPILTDSEPGSISTSTNSQAAGVWSSAKKLWRLIVEPIAGGETDSVKIEWQNLDAEPSYVIAFYKKELIKNNFQITVVEDTSTDKEITFTGNQGISGSLTTSGDEDNRPGTDYAVLLVNIPTTAK